MTLQSVSTMPQTTPLVDKPAADAPQQNQTPEEPKDKLCFGKIARGAVKLMVGVPAAAVTGTFNAGFKAVDTSVKAAQTGLDIPEDPRKGSISENLVSGLLYFAPPIGAAMAVASGAGPIGMVIGALAAPGVLGGSIAAYSGAIEGGKTGIELAARAGNKAQEKIAAKYGDTAGKVAKVLTCGGVGILATPVFAILSALDSGIKFGQKAIGMKPTESKWGAVGNAAKSIVVIMGYLRGALGASGGVIPMVLGASQGAGSIATTVAGLAGGARGFVEGAKGGYEFVSKGVDKLTSCPHCPNAN